MFHPLLYSYTPLAISSAEPTRPNITRHQFFSSALTGLVAIGVNKSNTIWCSARNRVMGSGKLQNLFWLYSNKTRLPPVDRGQSSDHEVYMERYAGSSDQDNAVWRRVLHFKTTKPSSAGNYTCATNYEKNTNYQTVKIQVSGEWSSVWVSRLSVTNWCELIEGFCDCPYLFTTWRLLGMVQLSWTTLSCCPLMHLCC